MKSIIFFIVSLSVFIGDITGQELPLVKSPVLSSVKIEKAEVVSDNPERLNLSFTYTVNNGKNYLIQGMAMDKNKQPIKDLFAEPQELTAGSGLVDLSFKFKKISKTKYTKPILTSFFIYIKIIEKKEGGGLLDLISGNNKTSKLDDALAINYEYKFQKDWRVGCTSGMVITTKLKAIGKAVLIKNK